MLCVCARVVNALILLPVVNLSLKWIQRHRLPIQLENFSCRTLLFVCFGDFSPHMRSFEHITISGLKSHVTFEFSAPVFL